MNNWVYHKDRKYTWNVGTYDAIQRQATLRIIRTSNPYYLGNWARNETMTFVVANHNKEFAPSEIKALLSRYEFVSEGVINCESTDP